MTARIKTALRLATVIALTAGVGASQTTDGAVDPGGWTKAKWGMTATQISDTFPGQIKSYLDKYADKPAIGFNGFQVDASSITYSVRFRFDKDGVLNEVDISPEGNPLVAPHAAKSNLLTGLTGKYGTPSADAPKRDRYSVDYRWTWILPSTMIRLSYSDYGFPGGEGITSVAYLRRQTNNAL